MIPRPMPGVRAREEPRLRASLEILDIFSLRPHERTQLSLLRRTVREIVREGRIRLPVLVEREHLVILDGHHRYEALKRIGCRKIPCYVVDYDSKEIGLTTWPGAVVDRVTKEEVVEHGLLGQLFPPKTTRHLYEPFPESPIPLRDLM